VVGVITKHIKLTRKTQGSETAERHF